MLLLLLLLGLYLQTLCLLTIHADTVFGYSYQCAGIERSVCVQVLEERIFKIYCWNAQ